MYAHHTHTHTHTHTHIHGTHTQYVDAEQREKSGDVVKSRPVRPRPPPNPATKVAVYNVSLYHVLIQYFQLSLATFVVFATT